MRFENPHPVHGAIVDATRSMGSMSGQVVVAYADTATFRVTVHDDTAFVLDWRHKEALHRADGPARVLVEARGAGFVEWRRDGNLERSDGPAVVDADGVLR